MEALTGLSLVIIIAVFLFLILFFYFIPVRLYIAAISSGVRIKIFKDLIGMRLRRVPPSVIVDSMIAATKAGIEVQQGKLEAHHLAGGNVKRLVEALISADKANIELPFERSAAIDLAGRDVFEAVKMSVLPKVIETPLVAAVAKDGIQLKAVARVTVRANIERLVGGAGEATVLARVGEGIVSTIGSSETHKQVLENPDRISKSVLAKGLDAGTAFEILSIDIADVEAVRSLITGQEPFDILLNNAGITRHSSMLLTTVSFRVSDRLSASAAVRRPNETSRGVTATGSQTSP